MSEMVEQALARSGLDLLHDDRGLALLGDGMCLRVDFERAIRCIRDGGLSKELVVKAARLKDMSGSPVLVDATAGFGEDSMLLAAFGFHVTLFEANPVISTMLIDAIDRAHDDPILRDAACRMNVQQGNSIEGLANLETIPDVIYLDPMFPARRKSAAVKKKFQLLQRLETPCADGHALLQAAIEARPRKIVIKRPLKGPCLGNLNPSYSIKGKSVRYDCLALS